jgi:hypothetical protein
MPRFIAFHPAPFLIGAKPTASRRPRPAPARFRKKRRRVKQVSSVGGKPGVKPDPPRALTGGAQIVDFSSKSDDEGTPERPDKTIS